MAVDDVDPVTLAVLAGRMEQIADEMDATLFRAAFNPIIAEAHDASHGLYDPLNGDTLVQGKSGLPIFVGVMSFAVRAVIDKAAADGDLADGDVFVFNDAHVGGTHLSDMRLVRPYFHGGRLFCYLASVGHWHDLGGAVPGNYNPGATDVFQEAIVIPPVRLARAGTVNRDIVDILMRNTRLPQSAEGDLAAQIAALDLGVRRMDELLGEYGPPTVRSAFVALGNRAETLMRAALSTLPDGRWVAEDFLDNDGIDDRSLAVRVALEIAGDRMVLDFEGTAPRCAGPVNIARPTAVATAYVAIKHLFPDLPANAGVMRPVEVRVPEGSLLAAEFPAPVGGYTETILRMIDVIFVAAAEAAPERAVANAYGTINALSIAGRRGDGRPWVMFSFYGGGHGACSDGDGLDHGNAPISTATIPPLEILEAAYPILFREWALRPDSAGTGEYRGGMGAVYEIEVLDEGGAEAFLFGERGCHPPRGIAGGGDAALNVFSYERDGDRARPPLHSKMRGIRLGKGEAVRLETPGGGGYGDARARDPAAVARDVERGAPRRGAGRRLPRSPLAIGTLVTPEPDAASGERPVTSPDARPALVVGVDVGGTFTDVFVLDDADGTAAVAKVPTTRPDPSGGFLDGIRRHVERLADVAVIVHGTTAGTNALLERKGARSGVITTQRSAGRARDAPSRPAADLGPARPLRTGDRSRAPPRGARADPRRRQACAHRWISTRCAARRASCWPPAASRCRCCSPTPTRTPTTSRWPSRRCASCGRIRTSRRLPRSCPRSASSSASPRPR